MNILKPLIIATSLLAASFSTFAYHGDGYGNGNGSWHRGGYQNQQQYNNRPCDNYHNNNNYNRRHQGMMQYSTSIQTSQPEEALKKIMADVPKGENGKQYMVKVAVVEIIPNTPVQAQ
ncbi:hypothetical protein J6836_05300 [Providencia sp. R33]|uniref:hypothetical protein n=1 Tax=Providencia sp. R33 TaxID=2828763 RepID=UPI001C5AA07F|nr:hypothetical protein [Providencia sp. R33]QXX83800.1 hypothetical protein J6836_05300 [Providencia sp. R33]